MINDVASKERERNRLEMVQNERNGKQSKKKWERERDLGPLLAIQLHHVISRR